MSSSMKIKAKVTGGVTEVKAIINHPMETGQRKDPQGKVIPAHYIHKLEATIGGRTVLTGRWGGGISKNPYISFKVAGANAGEKVEIRWEDNLGQSGSGEAVIR